MIDNTIEITYIQGKLTENLEVQCKLLEMGTNFTWLRARQVELEKELAELKNKQEEAA
tara:strand:+ start:535 stop:708 length:174 start_codon:yes stop_codon:yes gene_type:complete